jgi:hypothetical protein
VYGWLASDEEFRHQVGLGLTTGATGFFTGPSGNVRRLSLNQLGATRGVAMPDGNAAEVDAIKAIERTKADDDWDS